jgi:hypothetical protein
MGPPRSPTDAYLADQRVQVLHVLFPAEIWRSARDGGLGLGLWICGTIRLLVFVAIQGLLVRPAAGAWVEHRREGLCCVVDQGLALLGRPLKRLVRHPHESGVYAVGHLISPMLPIRREESRCGKGGAA